MHKTPCYKEQRESLQKNKACIERGYGKISEFDVTGCEIPVVYSYDLNLNEDGEARFIIAAKNFSMIMQDKVHSL